MEKITYITTYSNQSKKLNAEYPLNLKPIFALYTLVQGSISEFRASSSALLQHFHRPHSVSKRKKGEIRNRYVSK